MKRVTLTVAAGLACALLTVSPAFADGVNLYPSGAKTVTDCRMTYFMDAEVKQQYGEYVRDSLARVTAHTGVVFVELNTADKADIRYSSRGGMVAPNSGDGIHRFGYAKPDGSIQLGNVNDIYTVVGAETSVEKQVVATNLVAHETLHVLGLDHDTDIGSVFPPDEIMHPQIKLDSTEFGEGDLAGMAAVRERNGCSIAGISAPVDVFAPQDTTARDKVIAGVSVALVGFIVLGLVRRWRRKRWVARRGDVLLADRDRLIHDFSEEKP